MYFQFYVNLPNYLSPILLIGTSLLAQLKNPTATGPAKERPDHTTDWLPILMVITNSMVFHQRTK